MPKTLKIIALGSVTAAGLVIAGLLVNRFHTHSMFGPVLAVVIGGLLIGFAFLIFRSDWTVTFRK